MEITTSLGALPALGQPGWKEDQPHISSTSLQSKAAAIARYQSSTSKVPVPRKTKDELFEAWSKVGSARKTIIKSSASPEATLEVTRHAHDIEN